MVTQTLYVPHPHERFDTYLIHGDAAALDTEHGEERVARGLHREGVVLLVGLGLEERPVELVADLE